MLLSELPWATTYRNRREVWITLPDGRRLYIDEYGEGPVYDFMVDEMDESRDYFELDPLTAQAVLFELTKVPHNDHDTIGP